MNDTLKGVVATLVVVGVGVGGYALGRSQGGDSDGPVSDKKGATATTVAEGKLGLRVSASPTELVYSESEGTPITVSATITNNGEEALTGVQLEVKGPFSTIDSTTASFASSGNAVSKFNVSSIPAGGETVAIFQVIPGAQGESVLEVTAVAGSLRSSTEVVPITAT